MIIEPFLPFIQIDNINAFYIQIWSLLDFKTTLINLFLFFCIKLNYS